MSGAGSGEYRLARSRIFAWIGFYSVLPSACSHGGVGA